MSIEISDSAVEAATYAFANDTGNTLQAMRAALAAALPLIVGEPVGLIPITDAIFVAPDFSVTTPMIYGAPEYYLGCKEKLVPLYAIKQGASREG